jgi:hypothetical protein
MESANPSRNKTVLVGKVLGARRCQESVLPLSVS